MTTPTKGGTNNPLNLDDGGVEDIIFGLNDNGLLHESLSHFFDSPTLSFEQSQPQSHAQPPHIQMPPANNEVQSHNLPLGSTIPRVPTTDTNESMESNITIRTHSHNAMNTTTARLSEAEMDESVYSKIVNHERSHNAMNATIGAASSTTSTNVTTAAIGTVTTTTHPPQLQSPSTQPQHDNHAHHHHHHQQQQQYGMPLPTGYVTNSVHMEVQENAKIPNSYHIPVRRQRTPPKDNEGGGENNAAKDSTDGGGIMDDIMKLDEVDWNLTEIFLGNNDRTSAAAAYSNAGALLSSIGTKVDSITAENEEAQKKDDNDETQETTETSKSTTAEVKPSEVAPTAGVQVGTAQTAVSVPNSQPVFPAPTASVPLQKTQAATTSANKSNTPPRSVLHNKYSYGRPVPLPIPSISTRPPSQAKRKNSPQEAQPNIGKSTAAAAPSAPINPTPAPTLAANNSTASTTNNGSSTSPPAEKPDFYRYYPYTQTLNPLTTPSTNPLAYSKATNPPSATKKATAYVPPPFLVDATKKRSQFGFGNQHIVPSIPPPPTSYLKAAQKPKNPRAKRQPGTKPVAQPKGVSTARANNRAPAPPPPNVMSKVFTPLPAMSPLSNNTPSVNEGPSYERKKQRAKDARVKLNQAIENLSIAINLAGTQSKQRAQLISNWKEPVHVSSGKAPAVNDAKAEKNSTVKLMEEAGKAADMAKKWDRPSFVGTAATLVQGLNAQCEALMRENVQLRKERAQWKEETKNYNSKSKEGCSKCDGLKKRRRGQANNAADAQEGPENEDEERSSYSSCLVISSDSGSSSEAEAEDGLTSRRTKKKKKRKLAQKKGEEQIENLTDFLGKGRPIPLIMSFLDPKAITRCSSLSRAWRHHNDLFHEDTWLNMSVRRFGTYSVRDWQNQLSLNSGEAATMQNIGGPSLIKSIQLYQSMNLNNVKPKCHHEGGVPLGSGKIDNVVSAWVTMVERSNGELHRTVESLQGELTKYASLPIVELRILIQNVGVDGTVYIPEQIVSVDASTKRRGEEMFEITSDRRFSKKLLHLDGSMAPFISDGKDQRYGVGDLFKLNLFESRILSVFIHARSCSTTAKFRQKSNFAKVLVNIHGTTLPLVIPFT